MLPLLRNEGRQNQFCFCGNRLKCLEHPAIIFSLEGSELPTRFPCKLLANSIKRNIAWGLWAPSDTPGRQTTLASRPTASLVRPVWPDPLSLLDQPHVEEKVSKATAAFSVGNHLQAQRRQDRVPRFYSKRSCLNPNLSPEAWRSWPIVRPFLTTNGCGFISDKGPYSFLALLKDSCTLGSGRSAPSVFSWWSEGPAEVITASSPCHYIGRIRSPPIPASKDHIHSGLFLKIQEGHEANNLK